ncbi:Transmembrane 9 super member 3, partial [Perkinsus olseni]
LGDSAFGGFAEGGGRGKRNKKDVEKSLELTALEKQHKHKRSRERARRGRQVLEAALGLTGYGDDCAQEGNIGVGAEWGTTSLPLLNAGHKKPPMAARRRPRSFGSRTQCKAMAPESRIRLPSCRSLLTLVLLLAVSVTLSVGEEAEYANGAEIIVWMDKVGPYNNPHETYPYTKLGLCEVGDDKESNKGDLSIGEELEGHDFVENPFLEIKFGKNLAESPTCNMVLTKEKAALLKRAIKDNYWYEMYIDDLPLWAFVGQPGSGAEALLEGSGVSHRPETIYTKREFVIQKNGGQVISVDVVPGNPMPVVEGTLLQFTYSV